jgi:hypothetical protein
VIRYLAKMALAAIAMEVRGAARRAWRSLTSKPPGLPPRVQRDVDAQQAREREYKRRAGEAGKEG